MNKFWMVFVEGEHTPTYQHNSEDAARKEAERLCDKTGKTTYILESVEMVILNKFSHVRMDEDYPF